MKAPPFAISTIAQILLNLAQFFFCDCSKLGPKLMKTDKHIRICLKNGQKITLKADSFFTFPPIFLEVHLNSVHTVTHTISQFLGIPKF